MADTNRKFEAPRTPGLSSNHKSNEDPHKSNEIVEYHQFKVDKDGGILPIPGEGVSLVIPPDALPLDVSFDGIIKIGIHRDRTSDFEKEEDCIALSPTVTLEPHGLVFRQPVHLVLPSFAVPKLSKLPDTVLLCSETSEYKPMRWEPANEGSDKSIVAVYPKHVVVKLKHFCHLKYVTAGQLRPHKYANVLVFASYQRDSEKVVLGIYVVSSEQRGEAMRRGREEYDVFLTQDDFAVFTDDDAECCVNVGICDLPMDANTPTPPRPQEIPTQDIFGQAVRQVRFSIPMRNTQGHVQPSLECNVSLRQSEGLNRRIHVIRDLSRIAPVAPGSVASEEAGDSTRAIGQDTPILCVARRYVAIPPDLKLSLETSMTPEDKTVLAHAVCASDEADIDDLLVLWATAQGETDMVIGLANVFRSEGRSEIVEIIERYI